MLAQQLVLKQLKSMKFSRLALAAIFLSAGTDAFTGPQLKPRFSVQVGS